MRESIAEDAPSLQRERHPEPNSKLVEFARSNGFTQGKLADLLDVSRQWVNALVTGKAAITHDIAHRLARISPHPPSYWLDDADAASAARRRSPVKHGAGRVLVDTELGAFMSDGVVTPFNPDSIQPASYDLTLGRNVVVVGKGKVDLPFALWPGCTAKLQTAEKLVLPGTHFGRIGPISDLPRQALFLSCGLQVDPGYCGSLFVALHNHGEEEFLLSEGMSFLSLEIHSLGIEPETPYNGPHLNETELTDTVVRLAAPDISKDGFELRSLDRADLMLATPITGTVEQIGGGWVASSPQLSLKGMGNSEKEAVADLSQRIGNRFAALEQEGFLHGRLRMELERMSGIVQRRHFLSAAEVEILASRLGAEISSVDGQGRNATIRDGGSLVAYFEIPTMTGKVALSSLAGELSVTNDQLARLLSGQAGRSDYLAWVSASFK